MLRNTLEAMARLDYQAYEVVVIDNNNTNKKNWQAIQKICQELGPRFVFIHIDTVSGFKAGALNVCLQYVAPQSELLAIVDADYEVNSDFLAATAPYFNDPKIGIVQTPQDYSDRSVNQGLYADYQSFFALFMNQAQQYNAVTFTGTMGIVRRNLFDKGLRWNEWCITEDTEAGIYIHVLGYRGVYIDRSFGKGMMPLSYPSLLKQRKRWSYGNAQILIKDLIPILTNRRFTWRQKVSFLTQLTAWFHFELLLGMCFIASVANMLLYHSVWSRIAWRACLIMLSLSLLVYAYFYLQGLRSKQVHFADRMVGLLAHYGMLFTMSFSWIYCLAGGRLEFQVTNKNKSANRAWGSHIASELIITVLYVAGGLGITLGRHNSPWWLMPIGVLIAIQTAGICYLAKKFKELS